MSMSVCLWVFLLLVLISQVSAEGNVLGGGMHASRSHLASMMPVAVRLSKEDLSVHFLESFSGEEFSFPPNITAHRFKTPANPVHAKQLTTAGWRRTFSPEVIYELMKIGDDAFLNMQNLHPRKIETLLSTNWSLTIVDELFGTSMYGLAAYHHDRFKTPYIIHSTTTLIHVFAWNMGLGRSLIHRPSFWFPYNDNVRFDVTKFRQRLRAVTNALIVAGSMNFLTQNFDIKGIRQIGVEDFSFFNSWNQQAYNFHDDLMHFSFPAPISNEVKHVGRHCVNAKKLAPEFLDFVEDPASKGTIFIAFGTNVYWEFAPEHILDAFFDAVTELKDYRVVFSYNGLKPNRTIGSHVKLVSWSPQVEILSHKSTRLFITHGGLKSLREAICTAVPLIILPMAAEQTHNGAAVLEMGIAHVLSKFTISKKKLFGSIMEILENPSYKSTSLKIQRQFLDLPIPALDKAAFYANRATRLKDRPTTFKIEGSKLSWSDTLYLPLISCFLFVAGVLSQ